MIDTLQRENAHQQRGAGVRKRPIKNDLSCVTSCSILFRYLAVFDDGWRMDPTVRSNSKRARCITNKDGSQRPVDSYVGPWSTSNLQ